MLFIMAWDEDIGRVGPHVSTDWNVGVTTAVQRYAEKWMPAYMPTTCLRWLLDSSVHPPIPEPHTPPHPLKA